MGRSGLLGDAHAVLGTILDRVNRPGCMRCSHQLWSVHKVGPNETAPVRYPDAGPSLNAMAHPVFDALSTLLAALASLFLSRAVAQIQMRKCQVWPPRLALGSITARSAVGPQLCSLFTEFNLHFTGTPGGE